jgi:hypothetical protein
MGMNRATYQDFDWYVQTSGDGDHYVLPEYSGGAENPENVVEKSENEKGSGNHEA